MGKYDETKFPSSLLAEWDAMVLAVKVLKSGGKIVHREIEGKSCKYVKGKMPGQQH